MRVRQAANVLELLEFFASHQQPATLAEISDALGWPRSSTFNLVGTLADSGYLYEPHGRKRYFPSPRWLVLAQTIAAAEPLPEGVHSLVAQVAYETGETTVAGIPTGALVSFVDVVESTHSVRYSARVGDRVPIVASSVGRALLAQYTPQERQALYGKIQFKRYSATTPLTVDAVEAELREAEQRGYHQSNGEYLSDLVGVAMPLPLPGRRLSIVVAGPVSRCLEGRPKTAEIIHKALRRFNKTQERER